MENLQTERLTIEPMSELELSMLVEQYKDIVPDLSQAYQEMLDGCKTHPQEYIWYTSWKISKRDTKEEIGYAGFKGLGTDGSVEIGYGVDKAFEGHGYATEGVGALVSWALGQSAVTRVEAEAESTNQASIHVLHKLGFVLNGEVGEEGPRFVLRG